MCICSGVSYGLIHKLEEVSLKACAISEITLAELIFGAENSENPTKNHAVIERSTNQVTVLPIYNSLLLFGQEKSRLRKSGNMISDFDLLIGCTSIQNGLVMVTENVREFERITGITIENWVKR